MSNLPPRWADRFLQWYCDPDLLEEIQGDAHELYKSRVKEKGTRYADLRYVWDVLRFLRWSNIRRSEGGYLPGSTSVWRLNFKMAARNAAKNKMVFAVKVFGLSLSAAFALLITLFVVNEFTFDQFHDRAESIFRVSSYIKFKDRVTHYAVTPLPLGQEIVDNVPDVARYTRFMYEDKPVFSIGDNMFYEAVAFSADSNFLKIFTYQFLEGDKEALSAPDKIVLTRKLAEMFFGQEPAVGQRVGFGKGFSLEVSAVIEDPPSNSHLAFDALISWSTFDRNDEWENLNAYTYIQLSEDATIDAAKINIDAVVETIHELIERDYEATFEPRFEKIADIHFSPPLDEDIAIKGSKINLYILISVIILFFGTGLINYVNLSLSELSSNVRRIGILRVFGGLSSGHGKMLVADMLFTLLVVTPFCVVLIYLGWSLSQSWFSIHIDSHLFSDPVFIGATLVFVLLVMASSFFNSFSLSKTRHIIQALKGKFTSPGSVGLRKVLVGLQLSFSIIITGLIIIMVDQFDFIQHTDKGFDDRNTIVIMVRERASVHMETFMESLRKLEGVVSVEGSSFYPGIVEIKYVFQVETAEGMQQQLVPLVTCGYDYLNTLGVSIIKGRGFQRDAADRYDGFIVNETATKLFGWKDPVGKRILGPVTGQNDFYREGEVIGVVRDFNFASLHSKIEPLIIFPSDEFWADRFVYIKLKPISSQNMLPKIEAVFKNQWQDLPFEWEYLDARYRGLYAKDYQVRNLLESGLVISILISCLSIFSISALLSAIRTKEAGIRKVVGASAGQIFLLHMRSFILFLVIAMLIAWPMIGYLSSQWLQNFAYHVDPTIWYLVLPSLLALCITLCASAYHGVRGALAKPVESLKYE